MQSSVSAAPPPAAHGLRREALQRIYSVTLDAGSEGKGALLVSCLSRNETTELDSFGERVLPRYG